MTGLFLLTVRELVARKVVVGLFVVATGVWLVLALALQLDIVDGSLAGARLFGQDTEITAPEPLLNADGEPVVGPDGAPVLGPPEPGFADSLLEQLVFGAEAFVAGAAYWVGILLALFATGGLVAALIEPGTVDAVLSKPLSRTAVLAGRLAGVWAVALGLLTYLLGAVWLVLSLKTGVWNFSFLLAIPIVWVMFAVLYGLVTLVSVWTGSGPLALVVTVGVVFATLVLSIPDLRLQLTPAWRWSVDVPYHVLPKFVSVGGRLVPYLATGGALPSFASDGAEGGSQLDTTAAVPDLYPLASSVGFGLLCYAGAFLVFHRKDY